MFCFFLKKTAKNTSLTFLGLFYIHQIAFVLVLDALHAAELSEVLDIEVGWVWRLCDEFDLPSLCPHIVERSL